MTVQITPSVLQGTVTAIPSKSELHRALICAAFCNTATDIIVPGSAYLSAEMIPDDINATVSCLSALGAIIDFSQNKFRVTPLSKRVSNPKLNCKESGSTLRFLLPVAAASSENAFFEGEGRLPERPIKDMITVLADHGVSSSASALPFELSGHLEGGTFTIPGDVSSQYLTGLLLTLPLLSQQSDIVLSTELRSSAYIDITIDMMKRFGVEVECEKNRYYLSSPSSYRSPGTLTIGGDWSNAAAFIVAGILGKNNSIEVDNLDLSSPQGDKAVIEILRSFGAEPIAGGSEVKTEGCDLHGTVVDIDPTPDLMPVLSIAAMKATGSTTFYNASRLRIKESDRIKSVEKLIQSLNGCAESTEDTLTVTASDGKAGGTVDSFNDHRIVMAAAIASCLAESPVLINDAQAINKSYPSFFEDLKSVGGKVDVI